MPTPPGNPSPASTNGAGPSAMAHTGTAGTMGPPASGKYNATNPTVVEHIDAALVRFFTAKGFSGVTANCTGTNSMTASCKVTGTNASGQTSAAVLTIA